MKNKVKTSLYNNKYLQNHDFYSPTKMAQTERKSNKLNVQDRLYSIAKINELKKL